MGLKKLINTLGSKFPQLYWIDPPFRILF